MGFRVWLVLVGLTWAPNLRVVGFGASVFRAWSALGVGWVILQGFIL